MKEALSESLRAVEGVELFSISNYKYIKSNPSISNQTKKNYLVYQIVYSFFQ